LPLSVAPPRGMRSAISGSGAGKLFDVLEKKRAEVKAVLMPVNGFVSYSLVRTAHGWVSITIARTKRRLMRAFV